MNKNKILSGGGKNLTGGGKWGWRGREVGGEGEGSGVKGGGKWGERGREVGIGYPPVHPLYNGAQKHEGFVGFYDACSRAKTYVILTSLNYVQFCARYCL